MIKSKIDIHFFETEEEAISPNKKFQRITFTMGLTHKPNRRELIGIGHDLIEVAFVADYDKELYPSEDWEIYIRTVYKIGVDADQYAEKLKEFFDDVEIEHKEYK